MLSTFSDLIGGSYTTSIDALREGIVVELGIIVNRGVDCRDISVVHWRDEFKLQSHYPTLTYF